MDSKRGLPMRMLWLDFFRGIAALLVVVFHFHQPMRLPSVPFSFLAVDLFFVLSGIVLGMKYAPLIQQGMPFGQFAWHRLRRLYPMAIIVTLLILVMNACGLPQGEFIPSTVGPIWSTLLVVVPVGSNSVVDAGWPTDSAMYTLAAELLSNVVWFFALRRGRSFTAAVFIASLVTFLGFAIHFHSINLGWHRGYTDIWLVLLRALAWFGIGYFIAIKRPTPRVPISILLAGLLVCFWFFQRNVPRELPLSLAIVALGSALLMCLMRIEPKSRYLARLCAYLGLLSYPLYLIHIPADRVALALVAAHGHTALLHGVVLLGAGILAVLANEAIVRRLPRDIHAFSKKSPPNPAL